MQTDFHDDVQFEKKKMYSIGSNLENLTRDFLTGESKRFIQADF